ncbi:MAG: DUF86 domain-containing protein [Oscillospiraceae bacterium]|nr:DUF86 domain-containing protein [Oscillospiraceae bacterium]
MNIKDLRRIVNMKEYCDKINKTIQRFGADFSIFNTDRDYYQSITMSLFQIGELSNNLTDDFKDASKDKIPWSSVRAVRNMFAHEYDKVSKGLVWEIIKNDIPKLQQFCEEIIAKHAKSED